MEQIDAKDYALPDGFVLPTKTRKLEEGVEAFDFYGLGRLPWRIAMGERQWKPEKVKQYRMDLSEQVPVILFYRDKLNEHPVAFRRRMKYVDKENKDGSWFKKALPDTDENGKAQWDLPPGFDEEIFQIAWERFQKSQSEPGLSIEKWRATPSEARALQALGIFTVEGFGNLSEDAFRRKVDNLPPSQKSTLLELHDCAIAYANTVGGRVNAKEFGDKIQALEGQVEHYKMLAEELMAKVKGTKKTKKVQDEE